MLHFASSAKRFRSAISALFPVLALILVCSGAARADTFTPGVFVSYGQASWTDDATAKNILGNNFESVYHSSFGVVEVGLPDATGFSMDFTSNEAVNNYLPATGPGGQLSSDYVNPLSTTSGALGGEALALRLNLDFSDAGFLGPGLPGIQFGDLLIENTGLAAVDGQSVRQLMVTVNSELGGGAISVPFNDLLTDLGELNSGFGGGGVSTWADAHLEVPTTTTPTPEPSSVLLLACGMLGLGILGGWRRRRGMTIRKLSV